MNLLLRTTYYTSVTFTDDYIRINGNSTGNGIHKYAEIISFKYEIENDILIVNMGIPTEQYRFELSLDMKDKIEELDSHIKKMQSNNNTDNASSAYIASLQNDVTTMRKDLHFIKTVVLIFVILFVINLIGSFILLGAVVSTANSTEYNGDNYDTEYYTDDE